MSGDIQCLHIGSTCSDKTYIVVQLPDTDVFVLLAKYAQAIKQPVLFDTETGNKRRLLNMKQVITSQWSGICTELPALNRV